MILDQARLNLTIRTIHGYGKTPDSGFGALMRWLIYIHDSNISKAEDAMDLGKTCLNQDMRLRVRPLTGGMPSTASRWIGELTGYIVHPETLRGLSIVPAEGDLLGRYDWKRLARDIRTKMNGGGA